MSTVLNPQTVSKNIIYGQQLQNLSSSFALLPLLFVYFRFLSFVITKQQFGHTLEFRVEIVFYYRNLITSYVGLEIISIG